MHNPTSRLSFNTNLTWKQFDLGLFFNSVVGNDVYNNLANVLDNMTLFSKGFNTTESATHLPEAMDNGTGLLKPLHWRRIIPTPKQCYIGLYSTIEEQKMD